MPSGTRVIWYRLGRVVHAEVEFVRDVSPRFGVDHFLAAAADVRIGADPFHARADARLGAAVGAYS